MLASSCALGNGPAKALVAGPLFWAGSASGEWIWSSWVTAADMPTASRDVAQALCDNLCLNKPHQAISKMLLLIRLN
jgi:hypothetical protein